MLIVRLKRLPRTIYILLDVRFEISSNLTLSRGYRKGLLISSRVAYISRSVAFVRIRITLVLIISLVLGREEVLLPIRVSVPGILKARILVV